MPANKPTPPDIVHRLHALLHTLRVLQQQEDEFCSVLHTIERAGKLHAAEARELERLLTQVPAESLLQDVETLREALPRRTPPTEPRQEPTPAHAH